MIYIEDHTGYGLGNFVNLTPTIKQLSKTQEVKVYFHSDLVRSAFLDCPFITILDKPLNQEPLIHSGMVCKSNLMPDYVYVWNKVFGNTNVEEHSYVDAPNDVEIKEKYVVLINGTGNEKETYTRLKRIPIEYYLEELKKDKYKGLRVVGVGSDNDLKRLEGIELDYKFTGLRGCLSVIKGADYVVSNDCGLAHCAGAMDKNQVIFWKDTMLPKNQNQSTKTVNIRI